MSSDDARADGLDVRVERKAGAVRMVSGWQPDKWNPPIQLDRWIGGIGTNSEHELGGSRVAVQRRPGVRGEHQHNAIVEERSSARLRDAHGAGDHSPAPVRVAWNDALNRMRIALDLDLAHVWKVFSRSVTGSD